MTVETRVSLAPYTTLRAGGPAEQLVVARDVETLAEAIQMAHLWHERVSCLGWGSNVLPSDAGVPGLVVINRASRIVIEPEGVVIADSGCAFQDLFLKTAQAGLAGLEFAVGIPGTLGGALVSNAGAYRSNVSEFLTDLEIIMDGVRRWVKPDWMEFAYRDSVLRRPNPPAAVVLRARLKLPAGDPKAIYDEARDYQRQRIGKQPPSASAGSFFKNVNDLVLATRLPSLPTALREKGIVPAGYLIEACGLKGMRLGGAAVGSRHANFLLNVAGATASDLRSLAEHVKSMVADSFGVGLEEEVLYLGDWAGFVPTAPSEG